MWLYELARAMVKRYFRDDVGRCAAALAYYLVFTCFPFLLLLSALPGFLNLPYLSADTFSGLIPTDIINIVNGYLQHVSEAPSAPPIATGIILAVWFTMRAMSCLITGVRRAHSLPPHSNAPVRRQIMLFLATLCLICMVFLSLALLSISHDAIKFLTELFPFLGGLEAHWGWLRALLLLTAGGLVLFSLYRIAPGKLPVRDALPGTLAALFSWMVISAGYAFYVEHLARYTAIYGAIGAVIVFLLWLYMSGMILLLGAELNSLLLDRRVKKEARRKADKTPKK